MKTTLKNRVLHSLADLIETNKTNLIATNQKDLALCVHGDESLIDRLKIDDSKIENMINSIKEVINFPDPENKVLYSHKKSEGLFIENRTVAFGKILIIYESRPDVTIEAAITAFKAGNEILLKGGKEARNTNLLLSDLWQQALKKNNCNISIVKYLDYNRSQTQELIKNNTENIDLIIPRGGEQLIQSIRENTDIPMIISGRGNNFIYIDESVNFDMAIAIILDGKKRISVCNALDKVYIHQNIESSKILKLIQSLLHKNIKIIADEEIKPLHTSINAISAEAEFYEEYLSHKILLAMTQNLDQAIDGINKYSGGHSAVIVSNNDDNAKHFQNRVDCAAVYHNASSRFTDGGELGLGAEIAISTQKLHFRGPVGLNELVTNKWFISGQGHVRG